MGARHQATPESVIKKYAFDTNARILNTIQKLSTQQDNIPPPPIPLAGGGQNTGSGTSFPVLYPIVDLGAQGATITINLSNPQSHYQKLEISDPGSNITVNFNGLITTKAILFTLDIVLTSNLTHSIIWPSTLYGIPTTLPTTSGSRYLLEIIGFRSSTEERYTVIGVTNASGGGGGFANVQLSNLVSPTSINQTLLPDADYGPSLGENTNTNPQTDQYPNGTQLRWGDIYAGVISVNAVLFGSFGDQANDLIQYQPPVGTTNGFMKYNVNASSGIYGGLAELHSFQIGYSAILNIITNGLLPGADNAFDIGINTNTNQILPANNPVDPATNTRSLRWAIIYADVLNINEIEFGALGDQSRVQIQYAPYSVSPSVPVGALIYNVNKASYTQNGIAEVHSFQIGRVPLFEIHADAAYLFQNMDFVSSSTGVSQLNIENSQGLMIGNNPYQKLAFWGSTPVIQGTIQGSKGGNAALNSLLSYLSYIGLLVDSTT